MMRSILRAFLVVLVLVALGFLALGYWSGSRFNPNRATAPSESVGTSGSVEVEKARQRGAAIGEKAAVAAQKVGETMEEAALTTKIKAKMALDDSVKSRAIDVTTDDGVVTLGGTVRSTAERERAVSLARETAGVSRVIDHLQVR
jgi:osmotically-inducible protein OsmY